MNSKATTIAVAVVATVATIYALKTFAPSVAGKLKL